MNKRLRRWLLMGVVAWVTLASGAGESDKPGGLPVPEGRIEVLAEAVKAGRVVVFTYKGHGRTVEPHALGTASDGKRALLAWQTSGGSSTEPPPGWRVFLVEQMGDVAVGTATFAKRADYRDGKSRGLKSIEVEVATEAEARKGAD